jgi:hypothetical protein
VSISKSAAVRDEPPSAGLAPAIVRGARRITNCQRLTIRLQSRSVGATIRRLLALRADGLLLSQICCPKVRGIASNAWNQLSIRDSNARVLSKNIQTNCERIGEFIDDILSILPRWI